jgi:hypothetical protein
MAEYLHKMVVTGEKGLDMAAITISYQSVDDEHNGEGNHEARESGHIND